MRAELLRHLKVGGKLLYSLGLSGLLLYCACTNFKLNLEFWQSLVMLPRQSLVPLVVGAALLIAAILTITGKLERAPSSMLGWRLFQTNINFIPMHFRWLRWPFLAILIFQLPTLAFTEEAIFRAGWLHYPTTNWFDGFWPTS
jgi:membrane protease YdiL (CAAX protease family)